MDPETELITQMGLILTQLRYTRRAMEDIERSTSRYSGVAFATALQAGPHFGEPPLLAGALKVYVVNINDLAPGTGFGGFLEALLGGVGRFFGGFIGGLAGGTVGTIALFLGQLDRIATKIDSILDRLGLRGGAAPKPPPPGAPPPSPASATQGPNLTAALPEIRRTVDALTGLFTAAASGPDQAGRVAGTPPQTLAGQQWLDILAAVSDMLRGISRVIDGLILLVPILIGALAELIVRLDDIKLAIIDLLQFALRNVFLLRGVTLVTIYDTLSAVASLGANLLGIIATAVERILTSIFRIVGELLNVAVEAIRFLANGIQNTIDALLRWLITSVGTVLTFLGETRIFRVIVHIIQTLPAILPPLLQVVRGTSATLTPTEQTALAAAAAKAIPGPTIPGGVVPLPSFPDLAATLTPPAGVASLTAIVSSAGSQITSEVGNIFRNSERALRDVGTTLNDSATKGEEGFNQGLQAHTDNVVRRANDLASALTSAQQAAAARPQTGMEAIAHAYEIWLAGGGLRTILSNITAYFQGTPATGPEALRSPAAQIVAQAASEQPRATVEIQEVVIEITPPQAPVAPTSASSPGEGRSLVERLLEEWDDLQQRGYRPGQGLSVAFT